MVKPKQEGPRLLERIQVKGRDFDLDGEETPKEDLFRTPGLFKLKDVEERIPIDGNRLKYWYSSNGPYRKCFVKIPMGDTRSLIYVDLEMLSAEFQAQYERTNQI
jgi:hypothetical protein